MLIILLFSAGIAYADHFRDNRILVKMDLSSVTELQGFNLGGGGFSCQIYSIENDFIGDDSCTVYGCEEAVLDRGSRLSNMWCHGGCSGDAQTVLERDFGTVN